MSYKANQSGPQCSTSHQRQLPAEGMLPRQQWARSDDGFAAVCGLSLLQFALTEGLDGAQQGGAASSRSVRGGQRRRSGEGVRHGRRRRRNGLASWMMEREKRDAVWEKNKNAKTIQLRAASHETLCRNNPWLQLLRQIAQELLALQLAEAGGKPDWWVQFLRPLEASLMPGSDYNLFLSVLTVTMSD